MHYVATVLVPADTAITEDAITAALAPYKEETSDTGWWDWWVIGGRWTGRWAKGYDPAKDERNFKTCFLCDGGGKRMDSLGVAHRALNPEYMCNGCSGTGKQLKHAADWQKVALDERPASEVIDEEPTYTLVTPDGVWHRTTWQWLPDEERHEVTDDMDWPATYRRELSKHLGMRAVVVDYHS